MIISNIQFPIFNVMPNVKFLMSNIWAFRHWKFYWELEIGNWKLIIMFFRKSQTIFLLLITCYLLLVTFVVPAIAAEEEVDPYCFTQEECKAAPYNGTHSTDQAPECKSQKECLQADTQRCYYCYAPAPDVTLQVSVLGYQVKGIENYLSRFYQFLIAVSGIFAGIMIAYAGIRWMMAAGNPEAITDAKKKIGNAIIGLILIVSSYLILYTINPALVTLRLPPIKMARRFEVITNKCTTAGVLASKLPQLYCGETVQCKDIPDACGGRSTGQCTGQYCDGTNEICDNEVAMPAWPRGISKDAKCINLSDCKSNCSSIKDIFVCNSSICLKNNKIDKYCQWDNTSVQCKDGRVKDEMCTDDRECASGICMNGECTEKGGAPGGVRCNRDTECASGMCNKAKAPDECVPVGGVRQNGEDCELARPGMCGQGFHCVDVPGSEGDCSDGSRGAPCVSDGDCGAGLKCGSRTITSNKCE